MDGAGPKLTAKQPRERRLVRRTRLLAAIEESERRTVLLVAPAGYGKTTLARQWLEHAPGAWVTVTTASADIPVLARDLASALGEVAKFDSRRVEIALSAGKTAADQTRNVTRTILAQIKEPVDGWVVIDDYHLLTTNPAAVELIETLERSGKFKLMVTSRERPSWATSRRRVYLETLEFGLSELALDDGEIAELLPPGRRAVGLLSQARGWPAVIALAAHAGASDLPLSAHAISETLYEYVAEELFERASPEAQACLTAIAVLPPLFPGELEEFLGMKGAADLVVSTGLAYESDGRIEVHPLSIAFLASRLRIQSDCVAVAERGFELALANALYHHAFGLIKEFGLEGHTERLITEAFADLVETGRLATLEEFGRFAVHGSTSHLLLDLIAAEVALRDGDFDQAQSLGVSSAKELEARHTLKARAYNVAGRGAHLAFRLEEAFDLHSNAARHAVRPSDASDSAWGKCLAVLFLEDERVDGSYREFESLAHSRATDRLRLATARTHRAFLAGDGRLPNNEREALHLMSVSTDPWVRSSWRTMHSHSLGLQARYEQARRLLRETIVELDESGLAFAIPHVEWLAAWMELGSRHFSRSDALLHKIERRDVGNLHTELNVRALRARLHLAQQRPAEALEATADDFDTYPSRSMYGEYLSTRALALAIVGDMGDALSTATRALELTRAMDTRILCAAVHAIVGLSGSKPDSAATGALLDLASGLAAWDGVVCAARSSPVLLAHLAASPGHRRELRDVLLRSNDIALAKSVGLVTRATGSHGVLSSRECEIMEQVAQGRKNSEIAASFFISPGTVKSHLDHIFNKLGVRTRTAAVARYAEIEKAATDDSSDW